MLRDKTSNQRTWFAIFLGTTAPTILMIVGRPVEEVFTLHALLEVIRAAMGGGIAALVALHIDKPRDPDKHRTRRDDPNVPGPPVEDRRRLPDSQPPTPPSPPEP